MNIEKNQDMLTTALEPQSTEGILPSRIPQKSKQGQEEQWGASTSLIVPKCSRWEVIKAITVRAGPPGTHMAPGTGKLWQVIVNLRLASTTEPGRLCLTSEILFTFSAIN